LFSWGIEKFKKHFFDSTLPNLGQKGESVAVRFLQKKGYRLIRRNWKCKWGEIDAVFEDRGVLVVVEVKTRFHRQLSQFHVFDNIDRKKKRKLRLLADIYLSFYYRRTSKPPVRIDLVGVYLERDTFKVVSVEHLISAV